MFRKLNRRLLALAIAATSAASLGVVGSIAGQAPAPMALQAPAQWPTIASLSAAPSSPEFTLIAVLQPEVPALPQMASVQP